MIFSEHQVGDYYRLMKDFTGRDHFWPKGTIVRIVEFSNDFEGDPTFAAIERAGGDRLDYGVNRRLLKPLRALEALAAQAMDWSE